MMSPSSFAVLALKFLQKSMMFTPCGPSAVPTGGAGVALPAEICNFTIACTFFAIYRSHEHEDHEDFVSSILNFFHLQKIQFHRRGATENRDHHLQRALVRVHLVDDTVEARERSFVDPDV